MARADGSGSICSDVNDVEISAAADSNDRRLTAKLSSASFRSATSYASFRSCRSIKSSHSRASFKSAVSRGNSYNSYNFYSCDEGELEAGAPGVRTGLVNEGYQIQDNASFYSCNELEMSPKNSIISSVSSRSRSISDSIFHGRRMSQNPASHKDIGDEKRDSFVTKRLLACIGGILAGAAVAGSTYVPRLAPALPPWSVSLYRCLLQLLLSLLLLLVTRSNPFGPPGTRWRLLVSGLLNSFLLLALFLAVTRAPASLCATILLLAPVVTNLLSVLLCGEHVGLFRLLSICIYVSGSLLVTRPPPLFPRDLARVSELQYEVAQHNVYGLPVHFLHDYPQSEDLVTGVIAAVAAILIASLISILNRQCKEATSAVILFWSSLGSLAMAGLGLYTLATSDEMRGARSGREIPDNQTEELTASTMEHREGDTQAVLHHNRLFEGALEWLIATLISFLGILATLIVIKASQYIYPGKISLLQTTQVLVGYILVTSLAPVSGLDWLDLAGVILVLFTVLAIFFEERIVDTKRWRWF